MRGDQQIGGWIIRLSFIKRDQQSKYAYKQQDVLLYVQKYPSSYQSAQIEFPQHNSIQILHPIIYPSILKQADQRVNHFVCDGFTIVPRQQINRARYRMSYKTQLSKYDWNDSKQLFMSPVLSLEGRNMFPQIAEISHLHPNRDQPFLNILRKPIMSLYERLQIRSEKRPVCIVGMPKEVEYRHIRTGGLKRNLKGAESMAESNIISSHKDSLSTYSPMLVKTEMEYRKSPSKKSIPPAVTAGQGCHYYFVGTGNNSPLMERILARREGWMPTSNSIYNFRWEQARPKYQSSCPSQKQVMNHLPNHEAISDKGNLLENLRIYCQKNEEYMYKLVPVSFILDFGNEEAIQSEMKRFVQFYWECNNQSRENTPEKMTVQVQEKLDVKKGQSLPKGKNITNINPQIINIESPKRNSNRRQTFKNNSIRNIRNKSEMNDYQTQKKKQQMKVLYRALITKFKPIYNFQDMSTVKKENPFVSPLVSDIYGESSLWLLKPSDLNRGRGIHLFNNIEELGDLLKHQLVRNEKGSFILQKYLEKPMLIEERKFDIRVWAMISQNKEVFFFKEGYIRMSSQKYTLDTKSFFTHLTNNAVQKNATNYGEFEEGNILPLKFLYQEGFIDKGSLYDQIKRHIILSIKAGGQKLYTVNEKNQSISVSTNTSTVQKNVTVANKVKQFQIFGYDFMVDCNKHVWLIEVNTNPCIELSNKWLTAIIPRMLDDAMKLTIDRIFYRKKPAKESPEPLPVEGYSDLENMWEQLEMETSAQPCRL